ncbi:hypothetical protein BVX98_04205 [bacterium F11]|nr:hypothetical protein BVX98_04205 [bacterium F11]
MEKVADSHLHRYERKYPLPNVSQAEVEQWIKRHPCFFSEIYHQRRVNNIYLDLPHLEYYYANRNGLAERKKIRIRWYGETFGHVHKPILEFKIKRGIVGRKSSFALQDFTFNNDFNIFSLNHIFESSNLPSNIRDELRQTEPTLVNHYFRRYYQSADKRYRLTLDFGLEYASIQKHSNFFLFSHKIDQDVIVEIKYDIETDPEAEHITNAFPARMDKNSKYINGVDLVFESGPLRH